MKRDAALLRIAYATCRFLLRERDLPTLLQGVCDLLIERDCYRSTLLVLSDRDTGGMITAEAGLGDRAAQVMASLRQGRMPACGLRVLEAGASEAILCARCACEFCPGCGDGQDEQALCAPLRCTASLTGFLILRLPEGVHP